MKRLWMPAYVLLCVLLIMFFSCKKSGNELPDNKQLITGKWKINEIHLNVFYNGSLIKDSVLPQNPRPENYVQFNSEGSLAYCYNTPACDSGTYKFSGNDSVYATVGSTMYKWKILLLTNEIFNVQNTQPYPYISGSTAITYQTFIK